MKQKFTLKFIPIFNFKYFIGFYVDFLAAL